MAAQTSAPIIPAPARLRFGAGEFRLVPGATIAYRDDIDDLTFLLLPRLAGAAESAWGAAGKVRWPEHRDALARHERLWAQDGLTFFSAARI